MNGIALHPRNVVPLFFIAAALVLAWQASLRYAETSRFNVDEVTAWEAKALIDAGAIVIDVRDSTASQRDHLSGAVLFPLELLPAQLAQLEYAKTRKIVVYCGDGSTRGPRATSILNKAGFAHAVNLRSGIEGWRLVLDVIQTAIGNMAVEHPSHPSPHLFHVCVHGRADDAPEAAAEAVLPLRSHARILVRA